MQAGIFALMFCAAVSCNKSNNPGPTPPEVNSPPKIASLFLPAEHVKDVSYFTYDKQSRLTGIHAYSYDTSSGTALTDSFYIIFTLDASVNPPSAYDETMHYQGDPPSGETDHHELFYDGQNRITTDSITTSEQNDFSVQHFLYDNSGNTTIQWLFGDPKIAGSYKINQVDTLTIQSENIVTDMDYSTLDGNVDHLFTRSYSTHLNPVYNAALANSLGCLMVFNNFNFDFRSKNLPAQFNSQGDGTPAFTLNYLWTTDATGSVVSGTGSDKESAMIKEIYTYTY